MARSTLKSIEGAEITEQKVLKVLQDKYKPPNFRNVLQSLSAFKLMVSPVLVGCFALTLIHDMHLHCTIREASQRTEISERTLFRSAVLLRHHLQNPGFSIMDIETSMQEPPTSMDASGNTMLPEEDRAQALPDELCWPDDMDPPHLLPSPAITAGWTWHVHGNADMEDLVRTRQTQKRSRTKNARSVPSRQIQRSVVNGKKDNRTSVLLKWAKDKAPVVSGKKNTRQHRWASHAAAFSDYKSYCSKLHERPLCQATFYKKMHVFHIHPTAWTKYSCEYCLNYLQHEAAGTLDDVDRRHQALIRIQHDAYDQYLKKIAEDPQAAMLIIDYTKIHELPAQSCAIPEFSDDGTFTKVSYTNEQRKLNNFAYVMLTGETEDGPNCEYFDFFSHLQQKSHFVNATIDTMAPILKSRGIKRVFVWADGGIRNYCNMAVLSRLAVDANLTIEILFSAPHHGHGRADGHFGRGKCLLRSLYNSSSSESLLKTTRQVIDTWKQLGDTQVALIPPSIPPLPEKWGPWQPGIRSFYAYRISSPLATAHQVVIEGWMDAEAMSTNRGQVINTLDLSSLYSIYDEVAKIAINEILQQTPTAEQFMDEASEDKAKAGHEHPEHQTKFVKLLDLAQRKTRKRLCTPLGQSYAVRDGGKLPPEQKIEHVRNAIINANTFSGMALVTDLMIQDDCMKNRLKKICSEGTGSMAKRRDRIKLLLQDLQLEDIFLQ